MGKKTPLFPCVWMINSGKTMFLFLVLMDKFRWRCIDARVLFNMHKEILLHCIMQHKRIFY